MSRDELLESIAAARTLAPQDRHDAGHDGGKGRGRTRDARPDAFDDIPLGLCAVRELDQPDEQSLVAALCDIPYRLKHR
jgi:hypothetical protein